MSLGQPLLTAAGVKPCAAVLAVEVLSPGSGVSVLPQDPGGTGRGDQFAVSAQKSIPGRTCEDKPA